MARRESYSWRAVTMLGAKRYVEASSCANGFSRCSLVAVAAAPKTIQIESPRTFRALPNRLRAADVSVRAAVTGICMPRLLHQVLLLPDVPDSRRLTSARRRMRPEPMVPSQESAVFRAAAADQP